jgi:hypothetical protein
LPLNPEFAGSNLAKYDGFVRAIKMCSKTSFGREVKPLVPCRKIINMLKNRTSMKGILQMQNLAAISCQFILLCHQMSLLAIARELFFDKS